MKGLKQYTMSRRVGKIVGTVMLLVAIVLQVKAQSGFRSWALTPPMGWNSWDAYGPTVTESEVKANADYMASHLRQMGWQYIVVDIRWYVSNDKAGGYNQTDPIYNLDDYGRYIPAVNRFPSAKNGNGFQALADYVHSKGLKFGIHIMRGVPKEAVDRKLPVKGTSYTADQIYSPEGQCTWLKDNFTVDSTAAGAQAYYNSILELYALWGVDFIKVDDLSRPYHQAEVEMIRKAIDRTGREIVLSTSPGETPITAAVNVSQNANMWRMVDDVWDTWPHITHLMKVAEQWYPYIRPGNWPDCDMIPLGRISIRGERGQDRMTRLTRAEQYSLMNFFLIFRSPLMFGGDLPSLDSFTLSLLTNKAALAMHRDGTGVREIFQENGRLAVTSVNAKTGERYLAMFNISDSSQPLTITVPLSELDLSSATLTDLWTGKQQVDVQGAVTVTLPPHSSKLFSLKNSKP